MIVLFGCALGAAHRRRGLLLHQDTQVTLDLLPENWTV